MLLKTSGISPVSRFCCRTSEFKFARLPMARGIVPLIEFLYTLKTASTEKSPTESGNVPRKLYCPRLICHTWLSVYGGGRLQVMPCHSGSHGFAVGVKSHSAPVPIQFQSRPLVLLYRSYNAANSIGGMFGVANVLLELCKQTNL